MRGTRSPHESGRPATSGSLTPTADVSRDRTIEQTVAGAAALSLVPAVVVAALSAPLGAAAVATVAVLGAFAVRYWRDRASPTDSDYAVGSPPTETPGPATASSE